jgi:hypothetical protein
VIVSHNTPFNSLKVGDVIIFKTYGTDDSGQHEIIVHRVAEIVTDPSNGEKVIRTKMPTLIQYREQIILSFNHSTLVK